MVFIRRSGGPASGDSALCEECARGRGIAVGKGSLELSLGDLISAGSEEPSRPSRSLSCPSCGLEISALRRDGRLGCPSCADAFMPELRRLLGARVRAASSAERSYAASAFRRLPVDAAGIERSLEAALSSEDYEAAAALRDRLAGLSGQDEGDSSSSSLDFLLRPEALVDEAAPDADVVLWTTASVRRNAEGAAFPGAAVSGHPGGPIDGAAFRESEGWRLWAMPELGASGRRSLAERGFLPRGYAAMDDALLAARGRDAVYALLNETDHLRAVALRPGFDPEGALGAALDAADYVGRSVVLARRPELGWICARADDCGRGCSLSALLHLPALSAAGLVDRLFKALMADGAAIRGSYSGSEGSGGSLYEICIEPAAPVEDPVSALEAAVRTAVAAERRAAADIAERKSLALADAEGRAFGLIRHCRLLGAEEAASALSSLRLAARRGSLKGCSSAALAARLAALGPGSLGMAASARELPAAEDQDELRARIVKAAIKDAEYRPEEAARCSRD